MTFQAYLDTIKTKTGLGPDDFRRLAREKGMLAKFAIVAVTAARMDIGIKLRGVDPTDRFAASGSWNSMVTHRTALTEPGGIDGELVDWLRRAYAAA